MLVIFRTNPGSDRHVGGNDLLHSLSGYSCIVCGKRCRNLVGIERIKLGARGLIRIIEVDVGLPGIRLPRGEVGMVIAQPYVDFVHLEPFPLLPGLRDAVLAAIDATLAVARGRAHGAEKTHFTIFPECTLPGLEGFDRITAAMADGGWPTGTFVIGGFEGLTRQQFGELVKWEGTTYDDVGSSLERVQADQWVNCCAIWAKLESCEVRCWVQTKMEPAGVELQVNHQSMFKGHPFSCSRVCLPTPKRHIDLRLSFAMTGLEYGPTPDTRGDSPAGTKKNSQCIVVRIHQRKRQNVAVRKANQRGI